MRSALLLIGTNGEIDFQKFVSYLWVLKLEQKATTGAKSLGKYNFI
jgi:hypothetical protein